MKRLSLLILTLLMLVTVSACQKSGADSTDTEPVVMYIARVGSLEDGAYNASIINGLRKNTRELKFDLKILQSDSDAAYVENLKVAVAAKPDLIIGVGTFTDDLLVSADTNPNINFAVIDGSVSEEKSSMLPANFLAMNFDNAEGAFLMGVLAAKANTASGVGFIGGMDIPAIQNANVGYRAGVKAISAEVPVYTTNIDTFSDKEKAAQAAAAQNQQGAGVIFGFAGGANGGIIENAAQSGYWSIGVDQDQALTYPHYTASILCSMVKNVNTAAYDAVKMELDQSFKGGIKTYGVANGGISLGTAGGNITPELQAEYEKWQKAIIDGTVKIPKTEADLSAFTAPAVE